jgi:1-pyrroline-5-carboxylate dehydrogenase
MLKKAADGIRARRWELSALMGYEAGKNRLECVGDVEESADLIEYYCIQMEQHNGFNTTLGTLGPNEDNSSVLRPYGVWAVISPFNFPLALAAGPSGGALVAGNTVVFKPASDTPLLGYKLNEVMAEAGMPKGVFNFVTGGGRTAGQELVDNPGVDGIVFTGSKEVGMHLIRDNATRTVPRPLIIEMGGKNPALVMASADLDKASDGVMRSAFGAQGQKCSACSRVYVSTAVRDEFVRLLVEKTKKIKIGNPLNRDVYMGPVINEEAVKTYERAVAQARKDGGQILTGGRRITEGDFAYGYFVEPTIIDGLPVDHPLFSEELFVPITVLGGISTLDEAIDLANKTEYGLTAGIFSEDMREIDQFFDRIQAGVTYANRRAGATTGAWPGINSFGGWKASGSTGRGTGGPYYVQQFMREQSRVRIR